MMSIREFSALGGPLAICQRLVKNRCKVEIRAPRCGAVGYGVGAGTIRAATHTRVIMNTTPPPTPAPKRNRKPTAAKVKAVNAAAAAEVIAAAADAVAAAEAVKAAEVKAAADAAWQADTEADLAACMADQAARTATPNGIHYYAEAARMVAADKAAAARAATLSPDTLTGYRPEPIGRKSTVWFDHLPTNEGRLVCGPIVHSFKLALADAAAGLVVGVDPLWFTGPTVGDRPDAANWTMKDPTPKGAPAENPDGYMPAAYVSDNAAAVVLASIGVKLKGKGWTAAVKVLRKWLLSHIAPEDLDLTDAQVADVARDTRVDGVTDRRAAAYDAVVTLDKAADGSPSRKAAVKALRTLGTVGANVETIAQKSRTLNALQLAEALARGASGGVKVNRKARKGPKARC